MAVRAQIHKDIYFSLSNQLGELIVTEITNVGYRIACVGVISRKTSVEFFIAKQIDAKFFSTVSVDYSPHRFHVIPSRKMCRQIGDAKRLFFHQRYSWNPAIFP